MVVRTSRRESRASNRAQIPGPCGSADTKKIVQCHEIFVLILLYCSKKPNSLFEIALFSLSSNSEEG